MTEEKLTKYAMKKARMAADPQYAERIREEWRRAHKVRYAKETPEQREERLRRNREACRESYQKRKAEQALLPKPEPKPKAAVTRKPGRLTAMAGWMRW